MKPTHRVAGAVFIVVAIGAAIAVSSVAGSSGGRASGINPAHFTAKVDNPFMPWRPGTLFHYRSSKPAGATNPVKVPHRTKTVIGVRCRVVRDVVKVNGRPQERSFDWYAQDRRGNVWYFGENSAVFKHGRWVHSAADSWKSGVDGARPGIIMEAHPRRGDVYQQENALNSKDMARVLGYAKTVRVPLGTFHHVLVTKEFTPLEPSIDHDYYARGIGELQEINVKGGEGKTKLVAVHR
jgi:hypothetical protein